MCALTIILRRQKEVDQHSRIIQNIGIDGELVIFANAQNQVRRCRADMRGQGPVESGSLQMPVCRLASLANSLPFPPPANRPSGRPPGAHSRLTFVPAEARGSGHMQLCGDICDRVN
ncbi:MAG: hypothetical protein QF501_03035 [Anaerolineales bacterium]|nr:hypothetical protein [Anaerolineales bacterium]